MRSSAIAYFLVVLALPAAFAVDSQESHLNYDDFTASQKLELIRDTFRESWQGYRKFCDWHDECHPISQKGSRWGGNQSRGMAMFAIDSMSTMILMGLDQEFEEVLSWLETNLTFDQPAVVSRFETVIRVLGGLVSAYQLSGRRYQFLLDSAADLARRLSWGALRTHSHLPLRTVNLRNYRAKHSRTPLAEVLCDVLEMRALTAETGDTRYAETVQLQLAVLDAMRPKDGLFSREIEVATNPPLNVGRDLSVGPFADSFYETLLKSWIHTRRKDSTALRLYVEGVGGMLRQLLVKGQGAPRERASILADNLHEITLNGWSHLHAYAPGMLMLGEMSGAYNASGDVALSAAAVEAAYETANANEALYNSTPSGVAPERARFFPENSTMAPLSYAAFYILRPEALESWFYMWRATKDEKYRRAAWRAFANVRSYCRRANGMYASIHDVTNPTVLEDKMESFWMAETLKYLWLIFSDDDALDLTQWVLTTEAHPIEVMPEGAAGVKVGPIEIPSEVKTWFNDDELEKLEATVEADTAAEKAEEAERKRQKEEEAKEKLREGGGGGVDESRGEEEEDNQDGDDGEDDDGGASDAHAHRGLSEDPLLAEEEVGQVEALSSIVAELESRLLEMEERYTALLDECAPSGVDDGAPEGGDEDEKAGVDEL